MKQNNVTFVTILQCIDGSFYAFEEENLLFAEQEAIDLLNSKEYVDLKGIYQLDLSWYGFTVKEIKSNPQINGNFYVNLLNLRWKGKNHIQVDEKVLRSLSGVEQSIIEAWENSYSYKGTLSIVENKAFIADYSDAADLALEEQKKDALSYERQVNNYFWGSR